VTTETITPNDQLDTLSDRELLVRVIRQLDHIDTAVHQVQQFQGALKPLLPLIPRALTLLDPGAGMRKHLRRGRTDV
jgi:hypothetical protein